MKLKGIKLVHRGKFLSYYELRYSYDKDPDKVYEMVSRAGATHYNTPDLTPDTIGKDVSAVVMVVFNKDHSKILLSKEKRLGVNSYVYNNVAGAIEPGETIEEAAARELREETGLRLVRIIREFKPSYTCAPVIDELVTVVICEAEGEITGSDSVYEEIHSKWVTKQEALKLLNQDETLFSGRTQSIVYMWATDGQLV